MRGELLCESGLSGDPASGEGGPVIHTWDPRFPVIQTLFTRPHSPTLLHYRIRAMTMNLVWDTPRP